MRSLPSTSWPVSTPSRATVEHGLAVLGGLPATVGTYFPWIRTNPDWEGPLTAVYYPGMDAGFESMDYLVPVPVVLVLAAALLGRRGLGAAGATLLAGVAAVAVPLRHVSAYGLLAGGFVADLGIPVTVAGGLLLLVAGASQVVGRVEVRDDAVVVSRL